MHKRQEAIKFNRTIEFPKSLSYNNNRTNGIKKLLLLNKDQIELLWSTDHWSQKVIKLNFTCVLDMGIIACCDRLILGSIL